MTSRGVHQSKATMVTSRMLGAFRDRPETRQEFLSAIDFTEPLGPGTFLLGAHPMQQTMKGHDNAAARRHSGRRPECARGCRACAVGSPARFRRLSHHHATAQPASLPRRPGRHPGRQRRRRMSFRRPISVPLRISAISAAIRAWPPGLTRIALNEALGDCGGSDRRSSCRRSMPKARMKTHVIPFSA